MKQPVPRAGSPARRPGAVRFAAALLARHGLHHSTRGVERVMRRTLRARPVRRSNQWFSVRISPLVRLNLNPWSAAAVDSPAPAGPAATPADAVRVTVYRGVERLLQRLLHGKMQLSITPAALVKNRSRVLEAREPDPGQRADRRVPAEMQDTLRVLRQPASKTPSAVPAPQRAAAPSATETQRRPEIDRSDRSRKRPEAALDLVRLRHDLTREVVRTLDRRVIAHRERMGRS